MTRTPDKHEFVCEPLGPNHDRAAFSCESPALERYLKTQARQDVEKRLTAVFVLTPDSKTIAGYYSLSQFSVEAERIPDEIHRKLTRYQEIPVTLLGRLARGSAFRGQGVGELLLMDALRRCHVHGKEVGSWAVLVEAKDERAVAFYKKYGFLETQGHANRLFLPMDTISKLLKLGFDRWFHGVLQAGGIIANSRFGGFPWKRLSFCPPYARPLANSRAVLRVLARQS